MSEDAVPYGTDTMAAAKRWAVTFLRRLADELEHADRRKLADVLLRLRLPELAADAALVFPGSPS